MSDLVATSVPESATGSASERSGTMRRDEPASHTCAATASMTPALRKGGDRNHQRHGKKPDESSHCILLHSITRQPAASARVLAMGRPSLDTDALVSNAVPAGRACKCSTLDGAPIGHLRLGRQGA
jgi:hypothetical protein